MKELYIQLLELLKEIPNIKWVDLDAGQLQEAQPPVAFPCALVDIDLPSCEDIDNETQQVVGRFTVRLAVKVYGDTNADTPELNRTNALSYFELAESIYQKLQGFNNPQFYPFSRVSQRAENLRKGLKVIALTFETSWEQHKPNS